MCYLELQGRRLHFLSAPRGRLPAAPGPVLNTNLACVYVVRPLEIPAAYNDRVRVHWDRLDRRDSQYIFELPSVTSFVADQPKPWE